MRKNKKIGIISIYDNDNYGNRLQNYALYKTISEYSFEVYSLKNYRRTNYKRNFLKNNLLLLLLKFKDFFKNIKKMRRYFCFLKFNKNIKFYKKTLTYNNLKKISKNFDYLIIGSDQVWNPNILRLSDVDLLVNVESKKRIAYSASFAIDEIPEPLKAKVSKELNEFKYISVREESGKKIINNILNTKKVEVLIDPTMLLTKSEWEKVLAKPRQLKCKKYILNYFLGELSTSRREQINNFAKSNECEVINILDKNSEFYNTGPSEFLYLEKNAFLICTDSFHASVFAILFERPFLVFEREDSLKSMSSRLVTLLSKFQLEDKFYSGNISNENLNVDYSKSIPVLESERERAFYYLKKALDIE